MIRMQPRRKVLRHKRIALLQTPIGPTVATKRPPWSTQEFVPGGLVPNKAEFVEQLAQRLDGDKKRAAEALDAVIETVYASVAKGEKVRLTGFGIFERRDRAARMARNPATGASVRVKKTSVPAFRPGAEFRAYASGAKKVAKAPAKKAAAKRTTATKATKAPARKTAAKRAPAKRTATKRTAR
jgi:DNA-binding protein HU-beta